jgi:chemotaxis signal transduction protein
MLASVEVLRDEFDASFAAPYPDTAGDLEAFVAIRVGEKPYALRVVELSAVCADTPIVQVPSSNPAVLGLCGIRGASVPAFDLAVLLGEARAAGALRWLALSAGREPMAFAFGRFEGHLQARQGDFLERPSSSGALVGEVLHVGGDYRPVVRMLSAVKLVLDADNR